MPLAPGLAALACLLATPADPPPEPRAPVAVAVDTSEVPELAGWAAEAKALVEEWHPRVAEMLAQEGFTPPDTVRLVFRKDMDGVAHASGTTITIAADWVKRHPEDKGMVVHELVHVVQAYPRNRNAGWLVEGIADYIRFFKYEPEARLGRLDREKASYRDSYRTAARFLAWVERAHDPGIIGRLNTALRRGEYRPGLFPEATGKDLDALWAEFVSEPRDDRRRD